MTEPQATDMDYFTLYYLIMMYNACTNIDNVQQHNACYEACHPPDSAPDPPKSLPAWKVMAEWMMNKQNLSQDDVCLMIYHVISMDTIEHLVGQAMQSGGVYEVRNKTIQNLGYAIRKSLCTKLENPNTDESKHSDQIAKERKALVEIMMLTIGLESLNDIRIENDLKAITTLALGYDPREIVVLWEKNRHTYPMLYNILVVLDPSIQTINRRQAKLAFEAREAVQLVFNIVSTILYSAVDISKIVCKLCNMLIDLNKLIGSKHLRTLVSTTVTVEKSYTIIDIAKGLQTLLTSKSGGMITESEITTSNEFKALAELSKMLSAQENDEQNLLYEVEKLRKFTEEYTDHGGEFSKYIDGILDRLKTVQASAAYISYQQFSATAASRFVHDGVKGLKTAANVDLFKDLNNVKQVVTDLKRSQDIRYISALRKLHTGLINSSSQSMISHPAYLDGVDQIQPYVAYLNGTKSGPLPPPKSYATSLEAFHTRRKEVAEMLKKQPTMRSLLSKERDTITRSLVKDLGTPPPDIWNDANAFTTFMVTQFEHVRMHLLSSFVMPMVLKQERHVWLELKIEKGSVTAEEPNWLLMNPVRKSTAS